MELVGGMRMELVGGIIFLFCLLLVLGKKLLVQTMVFWGSL